jgi:hypothetical protein
MSAKDDRESRVLGLALIAESIRQERIEMSETIDYQREFEKRGQDIADAMGRYRGTEPLIDAVSRMNSQLYEAEKRLRTSTKSGFVASLLRQQGFALIAKAKEICDHGSHRHDNDSDGPGYTCNDCGEYGYGRCPDAWPCGLRNTK